MFIVLKVIKNNNVVILLITDFNYFETLDLLTLLVFLGKRFFMFNCLVRAIFYVNLLSSYKI